MFDKLLRRGRDAPSANAKKPTAQDFKGGAVEGAVFKDALTHPATIYPMAMTLLSVAWTIMIEPSPVSVGTAVVFLVVSGSSFIYNYVVKGPEKAAARVHALREQRRAFEINELTALGQQCQEVGFVEGFKEAIDLTTAFQSLLSYIKTQNESDASVESFRVLAEDTFKQGVRVLQQALATYKAIGTIDARTMREELKRWRPQLELMGERATGRASLVSQIELNERRLELYDQSRENLELLIAQVNEIEAALQSTYLELVDLGSRDPSEFLANDGGAVNRLTAAVTAARKVEERMRGKSVADTAKRNKYIQAAADAEAAGRAQETSLSPEREKESE